MKKSNMIKDAVILCAITLILGAVLAGVYTLTKEPIDRARAEANNRACEAVTVSGDAVQNTIATGSAAKFLQTHDLSDQATVKGEKPRDLLSEYVDIREIHPTKEGGYVYLADALKGYGGKISFALGIDKYGATTGISIIAQSETAGLGAKCEDEDFRKRFVDVYGISESDELYSKEAPQEQVETDPEGRERHLKTKVQAITGATVTSRAITRAVKGIIFYNDYMIEKEASNNE